MDDLGAEHLTGATLYDWINSAGQYVAYILHDDNTHEAHTVSEEIWQ